jgi:hypothetical protein
MAKGITDKPYKSPLRRAMKYAGIVAAGLFAVLLVLLLLLFIRPVRESILGAAFPRLKSILPGDITVKDASWTSLGSLEFSHVIWFNESELLLSADRIAFSVDLFGLIKKNVKLHYVTVTGITADIPRITSCFSKEDSLPPESDKQAAGRGFPREGSLPGFPSIAVNRMFVSAKSIRVNEAGRFENLLLSGDLDLLHGHSPRVTVDTLAVADAERRWRVEALSLDIDPDKGFIRGEGRGTLPADRRVYMSLSSDRPDRFALILSENEKNSPPEAPGIKLLGTLTRQKWRIESLAFDAEIRTPDTADLSRIPILSQYLEKLPALEGLGLTIAGLLHLEPRVAADATCDIHENKWLNGGHVKIGYENGVADMSEASLFLQDLSMDASARFAGDSLRADVNIHMRGNRWLKTLQPNLDAPEALSCDARVTVSKLSSSRMISALVDASGKVNDLAVKRIRVQSSVSLLRSLPTTVKINADAMDLHVGVEAEIDQNSGVSVRLSPIVVRTAPIPADFFSARRTRFGQVRYTSPDKSLIVENIRITGDGGDLKLNAHLDAAKEGTFDLEWLWPDPPLLLTRFLDISPDSLASLRSGWKQEEAYRLEAFGRLAAGEVKSADVGISFTLPGPAALSMLLPDSAHVEDMGPIGGSLQAAGKSTPKGLSYEVFLDLDRTEWIDSSIVHLHGTDSYITVDTVGIAFDEIQLGAKGAVEDSLLNIEGFIDVSGAKLIRRFAPTIPELTLHGDAKLTGMLSAPAVDAAFEASVASDAYRIPKMTFDIEFIRNKVAAYMHAPEGIVTTCCRLNTLAASFVSMSDGGGAVPARVGVRAAGDKLEFFQSMIVDTTGGLSMEVDTLNLTAGGHNLIAVRPMRFKWLPHPGGIALEDIDIAGTMGIIQANGFLKPDSSSLSGKVEVVFPQDAPAILVRKHLWPEKMELDFAASGKHQLSVNSRVSGFMLADMRRPVLDLQLRTDAGLIETRYVMGDSLSTVLQGEGLVPASIALYPPALSIEDGPVSLNAVLERFPMAVRLIGNAAQIPDDEIVQVDGRIRVGGITESLTGEVAAEVDFIEWPKLSKYILDIEASLGLPAAEVGSATAAREKEEEQQSLNTPSPGPARDLAGAVQVKRDGMTVLDARVNSMMNIALNPPRVKIAEGRDVHIEVRADSIPLEDFDPLLQRNISLGGTLSLFLTADGPNKNPDISGSIESRRFTIAVADQARMMSELLIRISGSRRKPVIEGDIEIKHALIRVPDRSRNLLPVEGESLLLAGDTLSALPDTMRSLPFDSASVPPPMDEPLALELDVNIKIPSGFWIRGKGLDLELSGELTVKQNGGKPTVTGELRVIRGTLVALGRTLELERGTVTFYGGDEINPSLDVLLGVEIEGTKIQITLSGTAQKPELKFSSEPELSEADIMSVLLFGRPYENLDDGQADLMKNRSRDMLVSIGASKLQKKLGEQLGLDVITIRSTGGEDAQTSFSFGKYLNPQLLLSYAYSMEQDSDSFIILEYFFKSRFKLETIFGQRGQTSLGVGWVKDY